MEEKEKQAQEKQEVENADKKVTNLDKLSKDLLEWLKTSPVNSSILINTKKVPFTEPPKPNDVPKKEDMNIKFDLKPKEIKAYLDRFVIKQEDTKKVLSIAISDHFNHIKSCANNECKNYVKQNVIMVGPTGVGKTFLIQCISELIGVPFVKSDATKFTETGYIGGDVEDLVRQLVEKAAGNKALAEYGIIYLDEIDKITSSSDRLGKDVSGRGVQSNLLKLLEETEVPLRAPWDIQSQIRGMMGNNKSNEKETINTKHILFIVSGAFVGLQDIIAKRVQGSKYGFISEKEAQDKKQQSVLNKSDTQDFVKFGMEPEFMGRLPVRAFCNELNEDDLFEIMKNSEKSLLNQFIETFNYYDIDVSFTDNALKEISRKAHKEEIGARGLGSIFEKTFRDLKYELPSTTLNKVLITQSFVSNPEKNINELLKDNSDNLRKYNNFHIDQFEAEYFNRHQVKIKIEEDVRADIFNISKKDSLNISLICEKVVENLECGFSLLKSKPQSTQFKINRNTLKSPQIYLEEWLTACFNNSTT
jgi:ATP-dependent Clp protease ATP-binding subunit ClpX